MGIIRTWIGEGISSNHVPICFQVGSVAYKPLSPFKYKSHCLIELEFKELVQSEWKHIDSQLEDSTTYQFSDNLKTIKGKSIEWAKAKYKDSQ
jgi:hypothetical protein